MSARFLLGFDASCVNSKHLLPGAHHRTDEFWAVGCQLCRGWESRKTSSQTGQFVSSLLFLFRLLASVYLYHSYFFLTLTHVINVDDMISTFGSCEEISKLMMLEIPKPFHWLSKALLDTIWLSEKKRIIEPSGLSLHKPDRYLPFNVIRETSLIQ